jgi:hypothetical protein
VLDHGVAILKGSNRKGLNGIRRSSAKSNVEGSSAGTKAGWLRSQLAHSSFNTRLNAVHLILGWLPSGLDGESAAAAAAMRGVEVTPLSRYSQGPLLRDGLQLGFAAVDSNEIRRGVQELSIALEQCFSSV